jgi:hypothetical protein
MKIFFQQSTMWNSPKLNKEDKRVKLIKVALETDATFGGKEK